MIEHRKDNRKGICEHDTIKYYCKDCNGKGLCEHGIRKYYCTEFQIDFR